MGAQSTKCCKDNDGTISDYVIYVKTGDKKNSGTDSNIKIRLIDKEGQHTGVHDLDVAFRNDFERGRTDVFKLTGLPRLGEICELELTIEESGFKKDWFLDKIVVEHKFTAQTYFFPCHRWLRESVVFFLSPFDCSLPQNSPHPKQRRRELELKRDVYLYAEKNPGLPIQVKELPEDEVFSDDYQWDLAGRKLKLLIEKTVVSLLSGGEHFTCLDEVRDLFRMFPSLEEPSGIHTWSSDVRFGNQRLNSCNPKLIKLCTELPENFAVESTQVKPFLEGWSLQTAINAKRIFIVDLKFLEGIYTVDNSVLCTPMALFFLTSERTLLPIAIQLFQEKGPDNPVFYPNDDPYVWLLAKMWYNNADASYHQSCVHLGGTHLLLEGVSVCTHRHISPSHPIFKLLAPHFLYLLAINNRGLSTLIAPDGWVDKTMTIGVQGMLELIAKRHAEFDFIGDGDFVQDLQKRGVLQESILPNYHYRDDGLLIYDAIASYVKKMVELFYASDKDVEEDEELQAWGAELVAPRGEGLGLKGIPGNGHFTSREQVVSMCKVIIFTCSVEHAAVNFNQYDTYAFTPNYPAFLRGTPPKNKNPLSEEDLVQHLPKKSQILDSMVITKILSTQSTRALGNFEIMYHHEPKALKCVNEFQNDLKEISEKIRASNASRRFQYSVLNPLTIPNSISI